MIPGASFSKFSCCSGILNQKFSFWHKIYIQTQVCIWYLKHSLQLIYGRLVVETNIKAVEKSK